MIAFENTNIQLKQSIYYSSHSARKASSATGSYTKFLIEFHWYPKVADKHFFHIFLNISRSFYICKNPVLSKNWTRTWTPDLRKNWHPKNRTRLESRNSNPKDVASCHTEYNIDEIPFLIESKGVQALVFVFEKYTTNFYFGNGEFGMITAIANL